MTRFIAIATVAGGLTTMIVLAATVGVDMPKLATQSHVAEHAADEKVRIDKLVGSVKSTRIIALENAISAQELRAGDLEIKAFEMEQAGLDARAVKDQAKQLRKTADRNERELRELRTQ